MKKRTQRLVALALSAMLALGLVACGNENTVTTTESPKPTQNGTEAKPTESESETAENDVVVSYPIDTTEKLTVFTDITGLLNGAYVSYEESPFFKGLAERTGIDAEWQFPAPGAQDPYQLMLTEKVLPNIIFTTQATQAVSGYYELLRDGVIWDLTDYLPTYAPDLWNIVTQPEYEPVLNMMKSEDGRICMIPSFVESDFNVTYMGPAVRKDWLDECGLDIPVTLDDWEEMLTKFKDKYGVAFATTKGYFLYRYGLNNGAGAFASLATEWFVEDGKVLLANAQPEWKEYLTYLNRWYEKGLIDPDSITMDNAALRTKVLNNEVGASFVPMSQLTNFVNDATAENTGAEWVGIGYPRTEPGAPLKAVQSRASQCSGNGAAITKSCTEEQMILALKYLNYGFTEEGLKYWNFGVEGETYTMNSDGTVKWTDLLVNDEAGVAGALSKYTGTSVSGISIQLENLVKAKNNQVSVDAVYTWIKDSVARKYCVPTVQMTEDETEVYSEKWGGINSYISEIALKFVTGEESLDNYDAYIAKLYEMGLQECMDAKQAAYERYIGR